MKKIIAIAAILAATQASAFWGNGYDNGYNNGYGYAPMAPVAPAVEAAAE